MEEHKLEFDTSLEGRCDLPRNIGLLRFVESRIQEIKEITKAIDAPVSNGLVFQRLPRHMRRRIMGHTSKRMPRSLRDAHIKQLEKSGYSSKSKRPSRRHRRRPANLISAYNRRQRTFIWLETHIWHAKRFHMTEKWGYKLPHFPNDKSVRACYRASKQHCLLHDISYTVCMEVSGPEHILLSGLSRLCNPDCGFTFAAQSFISGQREGRLMLYRDNTYPYGAIGYVNFIWKPSPDSNRRCVWIWSHPSYYTEVLMSLKLVFGLGEGTREEKDKESNDGVEARKLETRLPPLSFVNEETDVKLLLLKDCLVRFRLTGPLANAVLQGAFKTSPDVKHVSSSSMETNLKNENKEETKCNTDIATNWSMDYYSSNPEEEKVQREMWMTMRNIATTAQLPPNCVLGLTVTDPRVFLPGKRTKAVPDAEGMSPCIEKLPPLASHSPIWDPKIRAIVTESKLPDYQLATLRQSVLVPGTETTSTDILSATNVPVLLLQRPGNQNSKNKKLGFGCGWDVIAPLGWGTPIWQCLIMQGARPGGLRELQAMNTEIFEHSEPQGIPDTSAGRQEHHLETLQAKDEFFKKPPSQRPNFIKLGIACPFGISWNQLIKEWSSSGNTSEDFYVLRDKTKLNQVRNACDIGDSQDALVSVAIKLEQRGTLDSWAIICLPESATDFLELPQESKHVDERENLRKETREKHQAQLRKLRRQRLKAKRKGEIPKTDAVQLAANHEELMKTLWLPEAQGIRNSCDRQIFGFVTQGSFSFSEGKSAGVGYITLTGYHTLVQTKSWNNKLHVLIDMIRAHFISQQFMDSMVDNRI